MKNTKKAPNVEQRRYQIWQMLKQGLNQAEIAERLAVSEATISADVAWLREFEALYRVIEAESQRSGDPSIDALERQAEALEAGQKRFKPDDKRFLKIAEQVGWLRLKASQLREKLPAEAGKVSYRWSATIGLAPQPIVKAIDPSVFSEDDLRKYFHKLQCGKCKRPIWYRLEWPQSDPVSPELVEGEGNQEEQEASRAVQ